jgi:predicted metalloprotease
VYIDLGFFEDLERRLGAPGDFAQAYVLAHEIGHHVQHLLGTTAAGRIRAGDSETSVRVELQADCFAGVWANRAAMQNLLEPGDVEEGINAAAAVGDDRLQRMASGRVSPDAFTHGTSAQRAAWFNRGLASGQPADCDTFAR